MKIVLIDGKTIGDDIDFSKFEQLGEFIKYDYTTIKEMPERVKDADVIICNKSKMNETTLKDAKNVKLVCVTATGINNLDLEYLEKRNIAWRNVAGYSTECVAQHTFAMMFYLMENLRYYDDYVKKGKYINDKAFTHFDRTFSELNGKTWGIIGMGNIGKRVAQIAKAFGTNVIYYSTSGKNNVKDYERVTFDDLLKRSDFISVHAPLNENTAGLMDYDAFSKMKKSAIFLNLGRGPIVVEKDLVKALKEEMINAAALDVIETEPMADDCPLIKLKDSDRLLITPHIGWAGKETRERLMNIIYEQIKEFKENN
ncbi:glycerate dehydrogenase [Acetitomaculum ruminis DSM 5522]|uniref:Glycerate dehydrogenase n=1 Tax=Acetitomaculum ruminis DSM 5522 TaxID=1120918 RepID=A0A1I0WYX6_9FIRM|nr:D-2-hydroxyacid dehydrogenase [Acetitomaculum ruminis]SFA93945.1 glycerate dehydrogenase [Acetitomaculum ruminis DSM 5522]